MTLYKNKTTRKTLATKITKIKQIFVFFQGSISYLSFWDNSTTTTTATTARMETTARTKDNVSNMHSKMEHGTSNNNIPLSPAQSTIFSISQCSTTTIAVGIAASTGVAADPDKTFDEEG